MVLITGSHKDTFSSLNPAFRNEKNRGDPLPFPPHVEDYGDKDRDKDKGEAPKDDEA